MPPAPSSLLLFAGDRLTLAELCAARLDGDLVELGEAFLPADAAETAVLRAQSLAPLLTPAVALVLTSAAWVHGAIADPPARHALQRAVPWRPHQRRDRRYLYSDAELEPDDVCLVGGAALTTPTRTAIDLLARGDAGDREAALALCRRHPSILADGLAWLSRHPRRGGVREARRTLREWASDSAAEATTR